MATQRHRKNPADDVARLIALYLPRVLQVCRARLSRPDEIEDAVQETFVRFLLADRERITNPKAWFGAVAAHVCGDIHRWRNGHPEARLFDDLIHSSDGAEFDDVLDGVWFERLVSGLSEVDRRVLTLVYLYDLPRERIAEELGISIDHLRVMAFRARRRAQRTLRAYDDAMGF